MAELTERLRTAIAAAARELSDLARAQAADAPTTDPSAAAHDARRLHVSALTVRECTVMLQLAEGASWADVAHDQGRDEAAIRAQYGPVLAAWQHEDGRAGVVGLDLTARFRDDSEPELTAQLVRAWVDRHREPWDAPRTDDAPH